jgi:hypothetical protein
MWVGRGWRRFCGNFGCDSRWEDPVALFPGALAGQLQGDGTIFDWTFYSIAFCSAPALFSSQGEYAPARLGSAR